MSDPRVVLGANKEKEKGKGWSPRADTGWTVLRILGLVMVFAGGIDLALIWYPPRFAVPEWEFATIATFVAGLPVLTMGVVTLALAAVGTGSRGWYLVLGTLAVLVVAALAVLAFIYATDVPLALRVSGVEVKLGIRKSIVKTLVQFVTYGMGYTAVAWTLLRASRK